jgi:hypothetical protein
MYSRTAIHALFSLTLFPTVAAAASITVWEGTAFRGASKTFDGSVRSLTEHGWSDRISSLRVDAGRWEVCRDVDFQGCRTLTAEELATLEIGWNDSIRSLRPVDGTATARETPEVVAQRLYRAILGRDADPAGLRNAAAELERGRGELLIRGMLQSVEYRNRRAASSSAEILDQMHRALLGRPADTAARRTYLAALDRGEDDQVIRALLSSAEYGSADITDRGLGTPSSVPSSEADITLAASGAGLVAWGANGQYESLSGAKVALGRDGRARIDFTGNTAQTLLGTWTRESDRVARLSISEVGGRLTSAKGWVIFDHGDLAEIQVTSGTLGTRSSASMAFRADDYRPPSEETACYQQVRAQLEEERGAPMAMLFLTPDRSRLASGRYRLEGDALILAEAASLAYRCEVDSRRGVVLDATSQHR